MPRSWGKRWDWGLIAAIAVAVAAIAIFIFIAVDFFPEPPP